MKNQKSKIKNEKRQTTLYAIRYTLYAIRMLSVFLVFIMVISGLAGCADFRKKFVRKKKAEVKVPRYYRMEDYNIVPSVELYTKHYVYWRSWHRELMEILGQNSKKEKRCISEMIGNLNDMKTMLIDEKGDKLEEHIKELRNIENEMKKGTLSLAVITRIRRVLEKELMLIKIEFSYKKIESFIRSEFRR